ncbi:hypothetical protein DPMN_127734 [Dreissena polymorpha]|uniref:Uncharacterized protein n=1 Tax=Dreissena polymorpha TaxID=45954 RepID=A0A9D4H2I1_DREPO|nr:hypothetical protein DPMN_127734 [Dreissena polymorpha]
MSDINITENGISKQFVNIVIPLTGLVVGGKMRDDDTDILLQSGLLCAAERNSSMERYVNAFKLFIKLLL